jgi:hypothetical protein
MSARALAATLVAAMTFVAAPHVRAADLYGENYNPPADTGEYDEGPPPASYSDRGACDDRGPCDEGPPPARYSDRGAYDGEPEPYEYRGGSIKDGYPAPVPPPAARYDEGRYRIEAACIPRWQIKRRLRDEGWVDLWPLERGGPVVSVKARRAQSGRMFVLDVDRCTGEIVHARPQFLRTFGAYDPPRWRDRRPY